MKCLAIALALGLLYLGYLRVFQWDQDQQWLPYLGLWVISVVMGGSVCLNAMSFDAMRVRAALDSGARLWHLLVIKNLALLCIVAPIGFLLSALLAWRAGDLGAFFKACALVICFILLWLGVGNVLSIWLPSRDEPIRKRRQSGSLKQFLIAFAASYAHRLPGQLHARLAGVRRPGADRADWGRRSSRHPDRAQLHQHVDTAHRLRGRAGATAEDPPDAAEGDRRLRGQRRGPSLRRRTGSHEDGCDDRDLTRRPYDHHGAVSRSTAVAAEARSIRCRQAIWGFKSVPRHRPGHTAERPGYTRWTVVTVVDRLLDIGGH